MDFALCDYIAKNRLDFFAESQVHNTIIVNPQVHNAIGEVKKRVDEEIGNAKECLRLHERELEALRRSMYDIKDKLHMRRGLSDGIRKHLSNRCYFFTI